MGVGMSRFRRRLRAGVGAASAAVSRVGTKRVKRRGVVLLALLVPMFVALGMMPASANTGTVNLGQNCRTWYASVVLHHNVAPDRSVDVLTTIPGTTGFTGAHFDTSFGQIWSASGSAPTHGKVTLNIYLPNKHLEFTETKTLPAPTGCGTTTSTGHSTTTTVSTTSTAPTTTTTIGTEGSTASTTTTTIGTEGSTASTTPTTVTPSTMPVGTTVNAAGNVVTTSTVAPASVTTARRAAPGNVLALTGSSGPGPAIGAASLLGGGVMLLLGRRRRAA
jgi:hypothetical protein